MISQRLVLDGGYPDGLRACPGCGVHLEGQVLAHPDGCPEMARISAAHGMDGSNPPQDSSIADSLRVVLGIAVSSLDSGFPASELDIQVAVAALREAAVLLGLDPDLVTPAGFLCRYRGHHQCEPSLASFMLAGPDGVQLNAYRRTAEYPASARPFLKMIDGYDLGELDCPVLVMRCTVCGWTWHDVFADTSVREPAG